jgi:hypothetical protein
MATISVVETVVGPAKKIRRTWDEIWTFKS